MISRPVTRRRLLAGSALLPLLPLLAGPLARPARGQGAAAGRTVARVRPGQPGWPDDAGWERLGHEVGGRLVQVRSPLGACAAAPDAADCGALFKELKNPYFIGDEVGLTQTTGWADAWTYRSSPYAVAATETADIVAAVNFARENRLRLVVKGGGHSYLGRSNAPDSLLIWTRHLDGIAPHDDFVAAGCSKGDAPQPAVSIGSGAIWGHVYHAVATGTGRYVQGGGCLTVGVAGLIQAGGFGSFSKQFGIAAASLIEAEIVTADGQVRLANKCTNPDLFWALKGGGGGSFGVVTRLTVKTHDLPERIGGVYLTIQAASDAAMRRLVGRFVAFYADALCNPYWGEIVTLRPGNRLEIRMGFQGFDHRVAEALWQPFLDWVVAGIPDDFSFRLAPVIRSIAARHAWDPAYLKAYAPGALLADDRPGAPETNVFWAGNQSEAGHFIYAYQSLWLPRALLQAERREALADALCEAGRHGSVELHFQKGLSGGSATALAATTDTAINPKVLDAFVLAIIGGEGPPAYPGIAGHEPDLAAARKSAASVTRAMAALKALAPEGGSYFAESDFFEAGWQTAYWGANYPKLLEIKQKYDPDGLFFVHHGVGSEAWSADGFTRV